ncbi:MAG: 16S rRNA methyltransferase [Promethearchaeota archaeon]
MLHVILLDCSIEQVPRELTAIKQIQKHASRRKKKPNQLLLDQSVHGRAMTNLGNSHRRGRPDITFLSLLTLLETPLCKEGLLGVHLHLQDGRIVEISPDVRLPRNYDRFIGLFEQLLDKGQVPTQNAPLLKIMPLTLQELISNLKQNDPNARTILFVEGGEQTTIDALGGAYPEDVSIPVILGIGAFPHGDLSQEVSQLFERHFELDREVMMAWHVCAEALWTYSQKVNVVKKRFQKS